MNDLSKFAAVDEVFAPIPYDVDLSDKEAVYWSRLSPLKPKRFWTVDRRLCLAELCRTLVRLDEVNMTLGVTELMVPNRFGILCINPLLWVARQLRGDMTKMLKHLGLGQQSHEEGSTALSIDDQDGLIS